MILLTTSVEYVTTSISARAYFVLNSTGTFQMAIGTPTIDPNSPPLYNFRDTLGEGVIVSLKALGTDTYLALYQAGK